MGGKPDGQDTRKEEVEVEEGIDFKGAKRIDDAREAKRKKEEDKHPILKDRRLGKGKFRPGSSDEEWKSGAREHLKAKDRVPSKGGKKMWEEYLQLREARAKTKEEARKKLDAHQAAMKDGGESPYFGKSKGDSKDPWSTHASDAKAHAKEDQKEGFVMEADLVDAGRENSAQRSRKKLDGKDVDNSRNVVLMPSIGESVKTETEAPKSADRLLEAQKNESLRSQIKEMRAEVKEECCDKCGTPECTCEGKKEEKKAKKVKIDEAGMPIMETEQESRNNATGPTEEDKNPPRDANGEAGWMNPKGEPKSPKGGDRRRNAKKDKSLPNEDGTVPNGAGV